jgi:hypothetical protein
LKYTPTVADVGYHLVDVTRGDDVNISFYYAHDHGPVQTMVKCSFEYVGYDGFIMNTNYVLPNGGKNIEAIDWNSSEGDFFPQDKIVELKPGQYAFIAPMTDQSSYMIEYADKSYYMSMEYVFGSGEEEYTMSRFASLFYGETWPLVAQTNGVDTPIDVIGRDINGNMVVKATIEQANLDPDDPYIYLLPGKYYLKARATSTSLDTYYPSALLWSDATAVEPGYDVDEEWNSINRSFTIDLLPAPAALTGTGIVEGTVTIAQPAPARAAAAAAASAAGITIYLQQKGGSVVASTVTAEGGSYRFTQVPAGDYVVLVNIDGHTMKAAAQVTLSADQMVVSGVDYTITGNLIVPAGYAPNEGDVNGDGEVGIGDIVAITNVMAGINADEATKKVADVNGDGEVGIGDIVAITNIMAGVKN